jgi:hypothetical protein
VAPIVAPTEVRNAAPAQVAAIPSSAPSVALVVTHEAIRAVQSAVQNAVRHVVQSVVQRVAQFEVQNVVRPVAAGELALVEFLGVARTESRYVALAERPECRVHDSLFHEVHCGLELPHSAPQVFL